MLAPVPDSLRCGMSEGAKRLQYLRWWSEDLERPAKGKQLPHNYDRTCFDVWQRLREQGAYLIGAGVQ